ncbi:MAG: STAS domain-containing protein [Acidimicrobiia bacterium]
MEHLKTHVDDLGGGRAILHLGGEVDLATEAKLANELERLAQDGFEAVVIDATDISFMDSTGFHAFVEGKRLLHERGSRIILVASPPMRQILDLLAPEPIFAARVDSFDEAMALLDDVALRTVPEAS